jgi:hypothetical protein
VQIAYWIVALTAGVAILRMIGKHLYPQLRIRMDWQFILEDGPSATVIIPLVKVRNRGAPTTADDWHLTLRAPNGRRFDGDILRLLSERSIPLRSETNAVISPNDSIIDKTASIPIPRGGCSIGWLCSRFQGVSENRIGAGWDLMISLGDSEGRSYSTVSELDKETAETRFFPGLEVQPFRPAPGQSEMEYYRCRDH